MSEETVRSAGNLDDTIATLVKNFGEGSDYFKVLVNVFQGVLLKPENDHLKTFYIIGCGSRFIRSNLVLCKSIICICST